MSEDLLPRSSPTNVLLLGEYTERAGTGTYLATLLRYFFQRGTRVLLVTSGGREGDGISLLAQSFGFAHVRLEGITGQQPRWLGPLGDSRAEARTVQAVLESHAAGGSIDVVAASVGTPGRFIASLSLGRRSFYILHTYPHGRRQFLLGKLLGRRFPSSSRILTVSNFSRRKILASWKPKIPVHVLYSSATLVPIPKVALVGLQILTVGSVEEYKNPMLWIAVARRVILENPDVVINFVWLGTGTLIDECRRLLASDLLADRITFAGDFDDISTFYAATSIYLQPSKVESLGLAVLDAMSSGIVPVVSDVGGLPELVLNNVSGIICRSNHIEDFVDAINTLVRDLPMRNRMEKEAGQRLIQDFSPQCWKEGLDEVMNLCSA
jgi:glycosyltransferase involved in cell wall biosynthesis